MQQVSFSLPAGAARDDADTRRRFHEAEESHYRRLHDEGLVGGAWFRHRVRQARLAVIPELTNVTLQKSLLSPISGRNVVQFTVQADIRRPGAGS